ncbi:MAG: Hachiman antiphage defense system protein HamA [Burkholderiales bacterium]
MIKFAQWSVETEEPVPKHKLRRLVVDSAKQAQAIGAIAKAVPSYYTDPHRVADLLKKLGKPAAAAHVEQKLPTRASIRSGDLGEILCSAYVHEATPFKLGIRRLRWKDHRNMSMRGEDVLAFSLGSNGGGLKILKAEVKSRAAMRTAVIVEARTALSANNGLPSPHAIAFVADRSNEVGDRALGNALDEAQLKDGIRTSQVSHMLFTFSGNDPLMLLKTNLQTYSGPLPQHYIGLCVDGHQGFIEAIFEAVST